MDRMPRMADFARVLKAVDAVQQWTTLDDYLSAATDVTADVLGGDVFASAVIALASRTGEWRGTATELLAAVVTPDPRPKGNSHAAVATPPPTGGPEAGLARLVQLLTESSRLATAVSAQVTEAEPGLVAVVLAEAEAARRRAEATAATASARAAESAASASAAWEATDAAENGRSAAQSRAEAAEERAKHLQTKVDDLTRQLEAALQRVQAAERQATEMTAERDAARQDSEHVEDVLATERRQASEAAEQIRQQATREIASAQAACQAQVDTARQLAGAAVARAERAEAALDNERAERRALTERLTTVSTQLARSCIRTPPKKQPRLP